MVIAKLDASAEGEAASAHNVKGFPSLLFFPASAKRQRMKYEGECPTPSPPHRAAPCHRDAMACHARGIPAQAVVPWRRWSPS